jgi:hypothetical protein
MMSGERNFWELVYRPFMNRDLSRADVRAIIAEGLKCSDGSYKRLVDLVGIAESDYLKFMDFLRHHDLKPEPAHGGWGARSARSSRPQDAAEAEAQ